MVESVQQPAKATIPSEQEEVREALTEEQTSDLITQQRDAPKVTSDCEEDKSDTIEESKQKESVVIEDGRREDSRAEHPRVSNFNDSSQEAASSDAKAVEFAETTTLASSTRQPRKKGRMAKKVKQLEEMLHSPTNNFGLAALFKNFVLIGEDYQLEQCAILQQEFTEKLESSLNAFDQSTFNQYLRLCKRIAYDCPIQHISDTFFRLLVHYANETISTVDLQEDRISAFFSLEECPKVLNLPCTIERTTGEVKRSDDDFDITRVHCPYGNCDVPVKAILDDLFFENGRIRPHERILCWFPKYLEHFTESTNAVMGKSSDDSDVLRMDQKLYLAIMAVSCYKCDYLLNILEEQFVLEGGDLNWITEGMAKVDPRLARFKELNEIMAFRPWVITSNHFEKILKSDENGAGWSVAQLVKAVMVLATYHGLSCFVLGQGLTEDSQRVLEQISLQKKNSAMFSELSSAKSQNGDVSDADTFTIRALKQSQEEITDDESQQSHDSYYTEEHTSERQSHNELNSSLLIDASPNTSQQRADIQQGENGDDEFQAEEDQFSIHRANLFQKYKDFLKNDYCFSNIAEFNWEDHAFSVLRKYAQTAANSLNHQSEFAFGMSNFKYGHEQVKHTHNLRNAIVKYLMNIHGITDKYYNYINVNKFVHRDVKAFTKKIMTDPKNVTSADFEDMPALTPEDRAHLCILVMETKKRVELIFVTKMLSKLIGL